MIDVNSFAAVLVEHGYKVERASAANAGPARLFACLDAGGEPLRLVAEAGIVAEWKVYLRGDRRAVAAWVTNLGELSGLLAAPAQGSHVLPRGRLA